MTHWLNAEVTPIPEPVNTDYIRQLANDLAADGMIETAKDFRRCADEIDQLRESRS